MYFKNWAKEYDNSAGIILEKINKLKEELNSPTKTGKAELERRLKILYSMYLDCRTTSYILCAHEEGTV